MCRERKLIGKIENIKNVVDNFRKQTSCGPDHVCCVCFRLLFANQVVQCDTKSFERKGKCVERLADSVISYKYYHKCSHSCTDNCSLKSRTTLWICYTCQRKLLQGKMPPEASVNNLTPEKAPDQLACLNSLEQHLISLQVPFMKMLALPKGAQRAVQGPVICVPSDITKTTSILPRCETDDQLIRIKLKRKLSYKGHYKYQFVQKSRREKAIVYLKENNKWYKEVTFNDGVTKNESRNKN